MIIMSASWKQLLFQTLLFVISCRHINTKETHPTPAPLPPSTPLPSVVKSVVLKGESHTETIEVLNPISLTLECNWTGNLNTLPNITGYWKKDGHEIENSHVTVQLENEQYNLKKEFNIENEEALGNYSCIFGSEAKTKFHLAAPRIDVVKDKPVVSYVGDTAVIECKMKNKDINPNTWHWFRGNVTEKERINVTDGRYGIKNEVGKSRLLVRNVTDADAVVYHCGAVFGIGTTLSHVKLKVITIYEPLKPFIVIVIEVIILVAAILLYEKSRSKTDDNAAGNRVDADHTNVPTQEENNGQEGSSSMRQRKV